MSIEMILVVVVLSIIGILFWMHQKRKPLTYCTTSNGELRKDLIDMFHKEGIFEEKNNVKADIYLPLNYTNIENEYNDKIPHNNHLIIHAIKGCDNIVDKRHLPAILKRYYQSTVKWVPETFNLKTDTLPKDNCILVLKKNIQRQQGLKFIRLNDLDLNDCISQGFVIAQRALNDPLIVNKRKINIRYYLLIVIENGVKNAYLYDNGFIYYTKKDYKYSTDFDSMVTTGYIDRQVYEENPLTHQDLHAYLSKQGLNPQVLIRNVKELLKSVLKPCYNYLTAPKGKLNYQLFGVDIQPDSKLNVKLIEINKGPSTIPMDNSRDSQLKSKLQKDIYKTIKVFKDRDNDNQFKLLEFS